MVCVYKYAKLGTGAQPRCSKAEDQRWFETSDGKTVGFLRPNHALGALQERTPGWGSRTEAEWPEGGGIGSVASKRVRSI